MTMRVRGALAAILTTLALGACSTDPAQVDDTALLAELKAAGVEPAQGLDHWKTAMRSAVCDGSDDALELALTMRNIDETALRGARIAAAHYCPERVQIVDARLAEITR